MQELIILLNQYKDVMSAVLTDDANDLLDRCIQIAYENQIQPESLEDTVQKLQGKVEAYEKALECLVKKY